MSVVERVNNEKIASSAATKSENGEQDKLAGIPDGAAAPAEMEGLDELEQEIVLELEKEFSGKETPAQPVQTAPPPARPGRLAVSATSDADASSRLLEIRRKRDLTAAMVEQIRDGSHLFGTLAKQAGTLSEYLEKTEAELKRLDRIEAGSTKLRIASEGLIRNNHEMKASIEEQRKKVALLESKVASLRDANEAARTNLARLVEEKRIVTVDLAAAHSEVARLENDKRSISERSERSEEENRDLKASLAQAKDREKAMALEIRKHEDELSRKTAELEQLRERKTQSAMELEELKSRNATLESMTVEQKSRIDELTFEMKSSRRELEEIIRLKQQRILELESRKIESSEREHQVFDESMTPSIELTDEVEPEVAPAPAKPKAKAPARQESAANEKPETKSASKATPKTNAKSEAKQPARTG